MDSDDDDFFANVDIDAALAQAQKQSNSRENRKCSSCGFFVPAGSCEICGHLSNGLDDVTRTTASSSKTSTKPSTAARINKPHSNTNASVNPWTVAKIANSTSHSNGSSTQVVRKPVLSISQNGSNWSNNNYHQHRYDSVSVLNPDVHNSVKEPHDPTKIGKWMFPMSDNYPMREYQRNIVKTSLFQNTLVVLPTGLGKTFIAAVVIFNFLRWFPDGKAIFMAPTRPLVTQQVMACQSIVGIDPNIIARLMGNVKPEDRKKMWEERRLIFTTPQTAQKDCENGILPCEKVVLVVVDEAHRATGKYSFVRVTEEIRQRTFNFRILALSATPGKDRQSVQRVVDNLLISRIEHRRENDDDVKKYVFDKSLNIETIKLTPLCQGLVKDINDIARSLLEEIRQIPGIPSLLRKKETELSHTVVAQSLGKPPGYGAGSDQANYYRLQAKAAVLQFVLHARHQLICSGLGTMLKFLRSSLENDRATKSKREFLRSTPFNNLLKRAEALLQDPSSNPKILRLEEILREHFERFKKTGKKTSCIVFSQFRNSVAEICEQLGKKTDLRVSPFVGQSSSSKGKKGVVTKKKVSKVIGYDEDEDEELGFDDDEDEVEESVATKGQDQKLQQEIVRKFRKGDLDVLVATSIGEEGLDIGSVDIIVCFDVLKSPIRMVQRFGRAGRKRSGAVYILCSEGKEHDDFVHGIKQSNSIGNFLRSAKIKMSDRSPRMVPPGIFPEMSCEKFEMNEFHSSQVAGTSPAKKRRKSSTDGKSDSTREMSPLTREELEYYQKHICPPNRSSAEELWEDMPPQTAIFSNRWSSTLRSEKLEQFREYVKGSCWEADPVYHEARNSQEENERNLNELSEDESDLELNLPPKSSSKPTFASDDDKLDQHIEMESNFPTHLQSYSPGKEENNQALFEEDGFAPDTEVIEKSHCDTSAERSEQNDDRTKVVMSLVSSDEEDFEESRRKASRKPAAERSDNAGSDNKRSAESDEEMDAFYDGHENSDSLKRKEENERVEIEKSSVHSNASDDEEVSQGKSFRVGDVVEVLSRMSPNVNKPGGCAIILGIRPGNKYDVKYTVFQTTERNVPAKVIRRGLDVHSTERPTRSTRATNPNVIHSPTPSSSSSNIRVGGSLSSELDPTNISHPTNLTKKRDILQVHDDENKEQKEQGGKRLTASRRSMSPEKKEPSPKRSSECTKGADSVKCKETTESATKNPQLLDTSAKAVLSENDELENAKDDTSGDELRPQQECGAEVDSDAESLFADEIPLPPGVKPSPQLCIAVNTSRRCPNCGSDEDYQCNKLIFCSGALCRAVVHQKCYGVNSCDVEGWKCPPCSQGIKPSNFARRSCLLCPRRDGLLHPVHLNFFAHLSCLLHNPIIHVQRDTDGTIQKVQLEAALSKVSLQLHNQQCSICHSFLGACISCAVLGCPENFHASCALVSTLYNYQVGSISCVGHLPGSSTVPSAKTNNKFWNGEEAEEEQRRVLQEKSEPRQTSEKDEIVMSTEVAPMKSQVVQSLSPTYTEFIPPTVRISSTSIPHSREKRTRQNENMSISKSPTLVPVDVAVEIARSTPTSKKSPAKKTRNGEKIPSFQKLLSEMSPFAPNIYGVKKRKVVDSDSESTPQQKRKGKQNPSESSPADSIIAPRSKRTQRFQDESEKLKQSMSSESDSENEGAPRKRFGKAKVIKKQQLLAKKHASREEKERRARDKKEKAAKSLGKGRHNVETKTFFEEEASMSGSERDHLDEGSDLDDDDGNLSGLINDSSQLTVESSNQGSVAGVNPMMISPRNNRHGRHMNSVIERLETLAYMDEDEGEIEKDSLDAEEEEEEEEEEENMVLSLDDDDEEDAFEETILTKRRSLSVRDLKRNDNQKAVAHADVAGEKTDSSRSIATARPVLSDSVTLDAKEEATPTPKNSIIVKPGDLSAAKNSWKNTDDVVKAVCESLEDDMSKLKRPVVMWAESRSQKSLFGDVSRILRGSNVATVYVQRKFDLQDADFVISSRVCAIVLTQHGLIKLWRRSRQIERDGGGNSSGKDLEGVLSSLGSRYSSPLVIVQHVEEEGPDLQKNPGQMFASEFFAALMFVQEFQSSRAVLTSSATHSARVLVDLAQQEREGGFALDSLGLGEVDGNDFSEHTNNVLRFLLSNPGISLVVARRLILLHRGKSLLDFFKELKGAASIRQAVPGLEMKTSGVIWAYFSRGWTKGGGR